MRLVFIPQYALAFGCALWVLFAPSFGSQVPHLRLVNCGLAPLLGTKIPPQNPADLLPTEFSPHNHSSPMSGEVSRSDGEVSFVPLAVV